MKFKKGDYVKLQGYGDTVYRIVVDDHEHGLMCLTDENEITWEHPSIFELVHSDKLESSDQPTLSDFDRIRLETAAMIYGPNIMGESALKNADKLINLILSTPFKRTT